jgi:hypothetical protein
MAWKNLKATKTLVQTKSYRSSNKGQWLKGQKQEEARRADGQPLRDSAES